MDGKHCSRLCLLQSEETRLLLSFFNFFFFLPRGNKIAETSRRYPTKSRPNICDEYWSIDCAWQLLAEAVRRVGPCVRVHGLLAEIQAALCTPREWGLAYIECLCCRIESVEHLCLSPLTVKLGLTKNPSYTNGKWSRCCLWHFFHVAVSVKPWSIHTKNVHSTCMLNIYERDKGRGNMADKWRIMWWERWFGGEWRISSVCLLKGRAHMGDETGVYVD